MRVQVFAVGAALLAAALLAACGGSGDSGSSDDTGNDGGAQDTASDEPLSDDESDFLRRVGIAFSQSQANFSAFERILSQEQESAEALLSALSARSTTDMKLTDTTTPSSRCFSKMPCCPSR